LKVSWQGGDSLQLSQHGFIKHHVFSWFSNHQISIAPFEAIAIEILSIEHVAKKNVKEAQTFLLS
jgi:hypothetical protein